VGVRGMVALVNGPQYATGIGLVKYGAEQLTQARERAQASAPASNSRTRVEPEQPKPASGLLAWFKQAW